MAKPKKKKSAPQIRKGPNRQADCWIALSIAIVTFAVFFPALRNQFVGWDDYELLVDNTRYRGLGWDQLRWMFSTFHQGHYQPLSWITLAFDYLLWGMNPAGYHLTNILIHAANGVLFYFLALRLLSLALSSQPMGFSLRAAAAFAALFFAVHPLRVESVAWATERRDVLSGFFFLATVLCYLEAVTAAKDDFDRWRWLCASSICYGLSLLSKASGITLPVVLVLLDVYPLRRLRWVTATSSGSSARRIWWEKLPFAVLAVAAAVVATMAQSDAGAVASLKSHGLVARLAQSIYGLAFYLWKTIWPKDLSPFYEIPSRLNPFAWPFVLSGAVVVALSVALYILRRRQPAAIASWVYYLTVLVPVLGILQSGRQMVADRYSYLSCLGWALIAGAALNYCLRKRSADEGSSAAKGWVLPMGAAALIIVALAVSTWRQVDVWHDTDRLWHQVITVTDKSVFRSGTAHHLVGRFFADRGDMEQAIEHLRISVEIEPADATTYTDLGITHARLGQLEEAVQNLEQALALNPEISSAHVNLGNVLARQSRFAEAIKHFEEALKINPHYIAAYNNWGKVMAAQGDLDKAIDLFRRAVELQPDFAEAHRSLAMALAEKGRKDEAAQEFDEAVRIMKLHSQRPAQ